MMVEVATGTRLMKAAACGRRTSIAALTITDTAVPAVPEDGLLVRVRASSANPADLFALTPVARLQRGRKIAILGTDFAGIVEAVGSRVTRYRPGDEVFGCVRGAFAEYAAVAEDGAVARKPAGVSFEDAGTLGIAATTALQALRDHGGVAAGQHVLVNGASGGVGTFAVQIAKALGAEVTAVCSTQNVEMVRGLGADHVVDYAQDDFTRGGGRFDLVLDIAGSRSWSGYARALKPAGTFVGVGAAGVMHGSGGGLRLVRHLLDVRIRSIGGGRKVVVFILAKLNRPDLETLGELVESGRVKPVIDRRYDLTRIADALGYLDQGHAKGKIAIGIGA
jgi:NADPH:quinone reductase-like Zn-dependent oxidoreductase